MNKLYILLLSLLCSCASMQTPSVLDSTVTTGKKDVVVDQELMKDCGKLSVLSFPTTFENVLLVTSQNTEVFVECKKLNAAKKKILQDYVVTKRNPK